LSPALAPNAQQLHDGVEVLACRSQSTKMAFGLWPLPCVLALDMYHADLRHHDAASSTHGGIETSAFFVLERRRAAARIERPDATREDIMESSQKFVSTGLAVSMVLLSFVPLALAGPKEDVEAVTLAWGRALG